MSCSWLFLSHTIDSLQSAVFHGSASTMFSLLFIGSPETAFAHLEDTHDEKYQKHTFSILSKLHPTLARLFSAPLSVSILLAWFVWCRIPIAPHQKMLCLCKSFLRHLLCCASSFAFSASSFISFHPFSLINHFSRQRLPFPHFFRLRFVSCVSHHPLLFLHHIKTLERIYNRKLALTFAASLFEKMSSVTARKPRNEWRAHWMKMVLDTQRLSIPNTAVAIRKATTLHQQFSRMSVRETQSRDLTTERKNCKNHNRDLQMFLPRENKKCKNMTNAVCAV